ncbi:serine/threonine protein kinase [Aerosakkonema sp. BLCC-F2]
MAIIMFESGQILQERYQLQQQLGHTGAGRHTWLALDLHSPPPHEQAIVKLLAFSPQMQWEELKLFEREAKILQNLNHPRIPRYRDYFSLDRQAGGGLPWFALVQDYIPGVTLQTLLDKRHTFSEDQVRQIAAEVLDILIYLHELNPPVLHRDIKPSNLILAENKQVYLVDFGAVQEKAAVTGMTFTVVGTCGYTPIEQFWGRSVPASDLYALGATLIHLLTGTVPTDLPHQDSRIHFADRVKITPSFGRWIHKLTEPAVEKRFPFAREALQTLASGLVPVNPHKIRKPRQGLQRRKTSAKLAKSNQVRANGIVLSNGLGLIFLGGCFTIGIMMTLFFGYSGVNPAILNAPAVKIFLFTLYVLAFACFGGAASLITIALGGFLKIIKDRRN